MFFIVKNHWEPYFTDNLRSFANGHKDNDDSAVKLSEDEEDD
jgi:hypothetical protein